MSKDTQYVSSWIPVQMWFPRLRWQVSPVTVPRALLSGRRPEGSSRNRRSSVGRQLPRPPSRSSKPLVVIETGRRRGTQDVVSVFIEETYTLACSRHSLETPPPQPSHWRTPESISIARHKAVVQRLRAQSGSHSDKSKGPAGTLLLGPAHVL